jgi:hypothetical protein
MPGNTAPLYSGGPKNWLSDAILLTANATLDLTTGAMVLLATGGVNGSRLDRSFFQPLGTNIATVARFWINNGQLTTVAGNNRWFLDATFPISTTSLVASNPAIIIPWDIVLEPAFRLYAVLGTTVASGYHCLTVGGDY